MPNYLIIISVLLLVFTITISINIYFDFSLLENFGTVKLKIFKYITIFSSNVTIIGDYLNFSHKKSKVIKIKLDINDVNIQYFNELGGYIKNKILPLKLKLYFAVCLENAMASSLISSVLSLFLNLYMFSIRLNNKDMILQNEVTTGFRHNLIFIKFNFIFIVTLYDLIWSLLRTAIIIRRDYGKKQVQGQQNNN